MGGQIGESGILCAGSLFVSPREPFSDGQPRPSAEDREPSQRGRVQGGQPDRSIAS